VVVFQTKLKIQMKKNILFLLVFFLIIFGSINVHAIRCDQAWTIERRCINGQVYSTKQMCCGSGCYTPGIGCPGASLCDPQGQYHLEPHCTAGCYNSGNLAFCITPTTPNNAVVLYPSCGSANGTASQTQPTTNLCATGTLGNSGNGISQWFWGCVGQNTGWQEDTAWCFAPIITYPSCGSANGTASQTQPTTNLCATGTLGQKGTGADNNWFWGCVGQNTGGQEDTAWCSAPKISTTSLDIPFFANLINADSPISSADLGDTILLRFPGTNNIGKNITYYVQTLDSSGITWYNPFTWFGGNSQWNSFLLISGSPSQLFTVTSPGNHRINASIESENIFKISNNLSVSVSSSFKPIAIISFPLDMAMGSTNYLVHFNQTSEDEDDLLKITWDFGDNTNKTFYNYSKGLNFKGADTNHTYTVGGKYYRITLNAHEMNRPQEDNTFRDIYIFQKGINIVPIISSPPYDSIQANLVDYNASRSYIVNCTEGSTILTSTQGFNINNLECKYILIPGAKDPLQGSVQIRWGEIDSQANIIRWLRGNDTSGEVWNSTNYLRAVTFSDIQERLEFKKIRMDIYYSN
jgi:hypothetical protein